MSPSMISFEIAVPNISITDYLISLPLILSQDFNQLTPFSKGLQRYTSFLFCQIFEDKIRKKMFKKTDALYSMRPLW